jgi:hypothetical protein
MTITRSHDKSFAGKLLSPLKSGSWCLGHSQRAATGEAVAELILDSATHAVDLSSFDPAHLAALDPGCIPSTGSCLGQPPVRPRLRSGLVTGTLNAAAVSDRALIGRCALVGSLRPVRQQAHFSRSRCRASVSG